MTQRYQQGGTQTTAAKSALCMQQVIFVTGILCHCLRA